MRTILKAVVGSQAHGLAGPDSDFDYRGVFVQPTSDILSIGATVKQTSWIEGKEDDTAWELGHFLFLATKCNPTTLEVFMADQYTADAWGEELRSLFPHIWSSRLVRDAFIGYGLNQRKKFLDQKDARPNKYATAYVRSLFNAWELLTFGKFHLNIKGTAIYPICQRFRAGEYTMGEVIDTCTAWEQEVRKAFEKNPDKTANLAPVNDFLLQVRKAYWTDEEAA